MPAMIPNPSSQLVPGTLEPTTVSVSVGGCVAKVVGVGVGVGADCAWTVALSWFEAASSADDAVATFVTLPAVTSAGVIV
jgi:hypothetical protein